MRLTLLRSFALLRRGASWFRLGLQAQALGHLLERDGLLPPGAQRLQRLPALLDVDLVLDALDQAEIT